MLNGLNKWTVLAILYVKMEEKYKPKLDLNENISLYKTENDIVHFNT